MRDYIERNRLKTVIEKNFGHGTISPILQLIDQQPTADVVEVVYCEDCKHKEYCSQNIAKFGKGRDMYEAIHYCSYGERREDDKERSD